MQALGIDVRIWAVLFLALTLLFHLLNRKPRALVDAAVSPLKVPERRPWGYTGLELQEFRETALQATAERGRSALDLYRKTVLLIDIGFAISLAFASFFLWWSAVPTMGPNGLVNWIATMGWILSLFYGGFDIGEDASLYFLLGYDSTGSEAANFAAGCTIGKMIAITGSLFGLAIFLTLALMDWIIAGFGARR
ncbi:hypothetical protein [Bradyrhizobium sp. CCBAU 53415]|uniref:hypothetical protein n=1 Tax=Bradyrhizobium sp. CCBAU 53415 TaxID=1325119 RepID=UPI0023060B41|nr:hypothetical protein [Bradyrhizobium sp. CCBAU 53415]MDA9463188.1 hypothetical protein [Bradyrhizobium sp. CCBAU 53415]